MESFARSWGGERRLVEQSTILESGAVGSMTCKTSFRVDTSLVAHTAYPGRVKVDTEPTERAR